MCGKKIVSNNLYLSATININQERKEDRLVNIDLKYKYLIDFLSDHKPHAAKACAAQLQVSERSIRNYVNIINHKLKSILNIKHENGLGYTLSIVDYSAYLKLNESKHVSLDSPMNRVHYIAKRFLESKSILRIDDLAEEMISSRTTVVNDLKKAGKILAEYDLTIVGKSNHGLEISGNEINKRRFIVNNPGLFYENNLSHELSTMIREVTKESELADVVEEQLRIYILVMIHRLQAGFLIDDVAKYSELKNSREYEAAELVFKRCSEILKLAIDENEKVFLTFPFIGRKSNLKEVVEESNLVKIISLRKSILDKIHKETNISIDDPSLFEFLDKHLFFAINRMKYGIHHKNPLAENIKREYPLAYHMAIFAKEIIQEEYGFAIKDDETSYLAMYFSIFIEKENIPKSLKILFVSDGGVGRTQLFLARLKRILPVNTLFSVMTSHDFYIERKDQYDVVLSAVLDLNCDKLPIIFVDNLFTVNDLETKIKRILDLKGYNNDEEDYQLPYLNSVLSSSHFNIIDTDDYLEAIKIMCDKLMADGMIDDTFIDRLQVKEMESPAIFDSGLSIPHMTNLKECSQIELSVGILKKEVVFLGKAVKTIAMLIIPKENINTDLLIKLYDELIAINDYKGIMEEINNVRSYEELKDTLKKYKYQ